MTYLFFFAFVSLVGDVYDDAVGDRVGGDGDVAGRGRPLPDPGLFPDLWPLPLQQHPYLHLNRQVK